MGIFLSLGLQTLVLPDSPCVWVPGAFPLPHHLLPSLLSHAKDRTGTGLPEPLEGGRHSLAMAASALAYLEHPANGLCVAQMGAGSG